jgi:hypothetical protein
MLIDAVVDTRERVPPVEIYRRLLTVHGVNNYAHAVNKIAVEPFSKREMQVKTMA